MNQKHRTTETSQSFAPVSLLVAAEKSQLPVAWNQTGTDYPRDKCIHQLFEEQVCRSPDAVAVVFAGQKLTYRELNCRANQLAHYLQKLGVGTEILVGIYTEQSLEMVVGLLGILKAGAAYLPLDTAYPTERLAFILDDAQVSVLLTQQPLIEKLPVQQATVICLDREREIWQQEAAGSPATGATADNLAYVTYTSGSTGKPKGVAIPHRAVNRLVCNTNYLDLQPADRVAQASNIAFDAATFEIWGALLKGAQLVGIPKEILLSPQDLAAQIEEQAISVLFLTTALFNQLASTVPQAFRGLRYLLFGGEAVDIKWVKAVLNSSPPQRLLHVYGPTEATTFSSWYWVQEIAEGATAIPIGCPVSNTKIYLLDSNLEPVRIGVPGEIYIGGDGLARGYFNRPELTEQKFIPNPFNNPKSKIQNPKLYKTGDLARYLPDGNIEFLGRIDRQVKIRGFRIELEEIEAVFSQHCSVKQAVVIAREDIPGDKRLVAYLVPNYPALIQNSKLVLSEVEVSKIQNQLRDFLKQKLPDYMIPSAFVVLDSLPLTPNGKIDRRALPAPDLSAFKREENFAPPRTPTEEILANIWTEVLGIEPISIHDNFFELGGHSLLATQVISRLRQIFALELPLRLLFEAPTIAQLAHQILVSCQNENTSPTSPIIPRKQQEILPLSFAQQRLWFLNQLEPETTAYNLASSFRLRGILNVSALQQSFNEIVRRYEVLRTTFFPVEGEPRQVIASHLYLSLPLIDLQELPPCQQEIEAQKLTKEEAEQPFDLCRSPLIRIKLLRLSQEEHLLLLNIHHIVFDGWSFQILFEELSTLYEAFVAGKSSPLPELPIQYADFAIWQREWLSGEVLDSQLNYWKQHLSGNLPILQLPTDRLRPPIQTYQGASQSLTLPAALPESLSALSQQEGVTLFMTLLAAFKVLLYRHSGQEDIIVGTPIANRNHREVEGLIGFFVNSLALRTDLRGNPSFRELLGRVREVTLGAYAHQDLPFEKLVEELQPVRDLSRTPLFQVWFNMVNLAGEPLKLTDLEVEPILPVETTAKFDLTFYVRESDRGIDLQLVYNTVLFNDITIEWLGKQFQNLLEGIVAQPDKPIARLLLLTEAERQQLTRRPNFICPPKAFKEFHKQEIEQSIAARFEQQVEKYPDNLAVKTKNYQWTYRELNQEANRIAAAIFKQATKEEARIALLFDHDAPMIAAILGVLKAGKIYVPLDPNYPKNRISYILEDSDSSFILTNQNNFRQAQELTGGKLPIVNFDALQQTDSFREISYKISPDTLAYLLYTSGSTGQPKGVMQNHRNVLHFIRNYTNNLNIAADDKLTLLSSYSFDAAVMGIFGALLNGATLCPFDIREAGIHNLSQWLEEWGITIYHSTPTVFRHFLNSLNQGNKNQLETVRLVVLGGEEVVKQDVEFYQNNFSDNCLLINGLGPTESTVTLQHFINKQKTIERHTVPVGYPVGDTEILLLDGEGNPTDIYGEIAIKSSHVALGYWRKPELTKAVFLETFEENNTRIYRTGDLGRLRADGAIEFLGRKDFQVKIRGFRIELGEIEAALNQYPEVQETVVILREDIPHDKRLVAYVVPFSIQNPKSKIQNQLRSFLKEKLPDYLIPSAFVILESLPLTPSGKIDRRALPTPDFSEFNRTENFVPPRTPTEEILANIWTEVLAVEPVGIYDNFFELGGHSLLATQVISRLRQVGAQGLRPFTGEIPLRLLFEAPTIAQLAFQIQADYQGENTAPAPPILARERPPNLPLSFAQQRLWFLSQLERNSIAYHLPYAFRLQGRLNVEALAQSLQEIVCRYEILRTTFPAEAGQPKQAIAPDLSLNLPIIDLQVLPLAQREAEAQRLAREEAQQPFDLAAGPLIRVKLLRISREEHFLLLNLHHIVFDGWSFQVLLGELKALYKAFAAGEPSPLPALPIQYADFALWQREWLVGEVLASQLSYWQQQLGGALPVLQLPTERPRPAIQRFCGAVEFFTVDGELGRKLEALARQSGATRFMTLLAAFATLLARYSGQEDIVIGSPIANRNREEIEGLIGFFANTCGLRVQLAGNPSFVQLLKQVQQVCLDAYAHQDIPFEQVVEALQPERNLSHSPLFQVMFVLQNTARESVGLSGLKLVPLEIDNFSAKFDLTLSMRETAAGIQGRWEYNRDLFDATTITRMSGHFQALLAGIVANPEQFVSDLPLLTTSERQQLLIEGNATESDYPRQACIHQLFEAQAAETPDAVAVIYGSQQLTYGELNHRANQLAHYLRWLGIKPEVLVGICLERSPAAIVGLLGILKAGGAYVPLDPDYPEERLAFMLEDSQVPVLLTQQSLVEKLPANGARIVCLDADWESVGAQGACAPPCGTTAGNLAYVIYTSGSTGKPKGVAIPHQAVVRLLFNTNYIHLEASDRIAQVSNISFDAATFEIWGALLQGGKLFLVPKNLLLSPQEFAAYLWEKEISVLFLTTALFNQLASSLPQAFKKLRYLLFGGEAADSRWVQKILTEAPPQRLLHVYGPTESTTFSSWYWIQDVPDATKNIPIGRSISNTQIYLLDCHLNPVPIGVPGELYIGGDGLARGYLNRPELTQEKFIPNPFENPKSKIQNPKLYKTGDLARYLPDGNIEFLGRIDNQVKIRGFRIELGEIETVLSQHPQVRETVVIQREDRAGNLDNKNLVAYVVSQQAERGELVTGNSNSDLLQNQLRRFLAEKLPDYMLPSSFVFLDTLPLTPNGKVDRSSLPAPDSNRLESEATFVAPRDELELQLTRIWEQLLGVQPIGIRDNFFELGGHSLLAVRLFAQIERSFGQNLPLTTLFQGATIEQLASVIRQEVELLPTTSDTASSSVNWRVLIPIQPKGVKPPMFFVHAAGGGLLYYRNFANYLGTDQPFYGLESSGLDGQQLAYATVEEMATHYISEIRTIQPEGPYFLGGLSFGGLVAFEMAQQLQAQGQEVALLALLDTCAPGSIKRVPVQKRMSHHFNSLFQLGPDYMLKKMRGKIRWLKNRAQEKLKKMSSKFLKLSHPRRVPLPYASRFTYVKEVHYQAATKYIPQAYAGRVTLFQAGDKYIEGYAIAPQLGWSELAKGGVEIYNVPGNHWTILKEPHVQVLAEKFRACLTACQEKTSN
jgi:amino acid adenylation domain-containing protein